MCIRDSCSRMQNVVYSNLICETTVSLGLLRSTCCTRDTKAGLHTGVNQFEGSNIHRSHTRLECNHLVHLMDTPVAVNTFFAENLFVSTYVRNNCVCTKWTVIRVGEYHKTKTTVRVSDHLLAGRGDGGLTQQKTV